MRTRMKMKIPSGKREEIEMLDGRVFFSTDNWETVYLKRDGRIRLVIGTEADLARYFAVAASSASA